MHSCCPTQRLRTSACGSSCPACLWALQTSWWQWWSSCACRCALCCGVCSRLCGSLCKCLCVLQGMVRMVCMHGSCAYNSGFVRRSCAGCCLAPFLRQDPSILLAALCASSPQVRRTSLTMLRCCCCNACACRCSWCLQRRQPAARPGAPPPP